MTPRSLTRLMELLKVSSRAERVPGYSSALGLDHDTISRLPPNSLSFDKGRIRLRVPLTESLLLPKLSEISLSIFAAMIDDVTTWALVLADPERGRAGVSVSLHSEWGPAASRGLLGRQVYILAHVKKVGQNLGFVEAEVRDNDSGELVCFGSHIKYLPMGFFMDFLQSARGWYFTKLYAEYGLPVPEVMPRTQRLSSLFDGLEFLPGDRASLKISKAHASLGGALHGGCHATLMELVAAKAVARSLGLTDHEVVPCGSLDVQYISSPSPKQVEVTVDILQGPTKESLIPVRVKILSGSRLNSEGLLHFPHPAQGSTSRSRL